jgi:hypothetical protein
MIALLVTLTEAEILNNLNAYGPYIEMLLKKRQFSEDFLEKTSAWYDSWVCLKHQKSLSREFCIRVLLDKPTDSADNWTSLNDIDYYFEKSK